MEATYCGESATDSVPVAVANGTISGCESLAQISNNAALLDLSSDFSQQKIGSAACSINRDINPARLWL